MVITAILTYPIIGLIIVMEAHYSEYSLKDPNNLVYFGDAKADPRYMITLSFSTFPWNIVLMVIVIIIWIVTFIDTMFYFARI